MTPDEIYKHAHATAYDSLLPHTQHAQVRDVMAEVVASHLIGNGEHGRGRWMVFSVNGDRRRTVTNALLRDLGRHESLTLPPVNALDAVVKTVADALLDVTAPAAEGAAVSETKD